MTDHPQIPDSRGRLIDTAARAMFAYEWTERGWTWDQAGEDDHAYWFAAAEAVVDALGIEPANLSDYDTSEELDAYFVACLEAPAIQTHDSEETA